MFEGVTYWISLRQLKVHELMKTIQLLENDGQSWGQIYLQLGEIQTQGTKRLAKLWGTLVALYLTINAFSDGSTVVFEAYGISASLPLGAATLAGSVGLFLLTLNLQNIVSVLLARAKHSAKSKRRNMSANAYGLYYGQDELALSIPIVLNPFFKQIIPASSALITMFLLVFLFLTIPAAALWQYLFMEQLSVVSNVSLVSSNGLLCVAGLSILGMSVLWIILFNIPIPWKKDAYSIRWGVLARVNGTNSHPQSPKWIDELPSKR